MHPPLLVGVLGRLRQLPYDLSRLPWLIESASQAPSVQVLQCEVKSPPRLPNCVDLDNVRVPELGSRLSLSADVCGIPGTRQGSH